MPVRLVALLCVQAALGAAPLYRNSTASTAARADDLLARRVLQTPTETDALNATEPILDTGFGVFELLNKQCAVPLPD